MKGCDSQCEFDKCAVEEVTGSCSLGDKKLMESEIFPPRRNVSCQKLEEAEI